MLTGLINVEIAVIEFSQVMYTKYHHKKTDKIIIIIIMIDIAVWGEHVEVLLVIIKDNLITFDCHLATVCLNSNREVLSRLPAVVEGAWEELFGIECNETVTMEPVNNRQKSVKVIDKRPHTKRKGELYNLLGCYGILPTKMHAGKGIFFPIVREGDLEEILKKEVMETALEKGFEIKIPIEYSAMKTVIV